MNITQELKIEIYHALADFLEAYKTENTQVLAEKFGISGEFLEEIYEIKWIWCFCKKYADGGAFLQGYIWI